MRPLVLAVLLFVLALVAPALAQAAEKNVVRVVFELDDPHYTDEFSDAELGALRAGAAQGISEVLSERFRFLTFQSDAEAAYTLTVRLGRAEGSGTNNTEFGFHFGLTGPDVPQDAKSYLVFRTKDQFLAPIGTPEALTVELRERMAQVGRDRLILDLLHYVSIAETGEFRGGEPPIWLIDRDRERLCMTRRSHLELLTVIPSPQLGRVRESFAARVIDIVPADGAADAPVIAGARIVATPAETVDAGIVQRLKAAPPAEVRIERVFVVAYEPICSPEPVSAAEVSFSAAGAPP